MQPSMAARPPLASRRVGRLRAAAPTPSRHLSAVAGAATTDQWRGGICDEAGAATSGRWFWRCGGPNLGGSSARGCGAMRHSQFWLGLAEVPPDDLLLFWMATTVHERRDGDVALGGRDGVFPVHFRRWHVDVWCCPAAIWCCPWWVLTAAGSMTSLGFVAAVGLELCVSGWGFGFLWVKT